MSVFTVFCHGTGENRVTATASDELVAYFHNNIAGNEAALAGSAVTPGRYLVNDGPGHGGDNLALPQQVNPITGNARTNLKFPWSKPSFADHAHGNTGGQKNMATARGVVSGQGWDENTQRTVNVIQDLKFTHGDDIDQVNLVGWSRGAVTCLRIANLMKQVFSTSIRCNIFAVDPVAGGDAGTKMVDTKAIGDNVTNYIGILSMHERRSTFSPQDLSRVSYNSGNTNCIFLPMPGNHSAQVMVKSPPEAAQITRNLACAFLQSWGSPITKKPFGSLNSSATMVTAYSQLVLSLSEHGSYQTSRMQGIKGGGPALRRRDFAKHSKMDTYTRGGKESYWINEHHRACFADAFPDIYQLIFETTSYAEMELTRHSRFSDFMTILLNNTPLRHSLMAKGLVVPTGSPAVFMMGIGAGRYANNVRKTWDPAWPLFA